MLSRFRLKISRDLQFPHSVRIVVLSGVLRSHWGDRIISLFALWVCYHSSVVILLSVYDVCLLQSNLSWLAGWEVPRLRSLWEAKSTAKKTFLSSVPRLCNQYEFSHWCYAWWSRREIPSMCERTSWLSKRRTIYKAFKTRRQESFVIRRTGTSEEKSKSRPNPKRILINITEIDWFKDWSIFIRCQEEK
jgi:hypothetical protein